MKIKSILIALMVYGPAMFFLSAQPALQAGLNRYRAGDKLIKQQMSYANPGPDGKNVTWDYSNLSTVGDAYPVLYFYDADTLSLTGWEHETHYRYSYREESLFLEGYNNRRMELAFNEPEIQLYFPLLYGDSLSRPFSGEGLYFREHAMVAAGRTTLTADGMGTLITPGRDTLSSVLRIKRIREYEDIGVEGALMRLETYLWYAKGYRYPVFESIRSLVIKEGEETEDLLTSFYYPPSAMQALAEDPENETLREEMLQDSNIFLSCEASPNPVEDTAVLRFELSVAARISAQLCDIVGNPVAGVIPGENLNEGIHERAFSMAGLRRGHYLLHLTANQYVKNLVVIKK